MSLNRTSILLIASIGAALLNLLGRGDLIDSLTPRLGDLALWLASAAALVVQVVKALTIEVSTNERGLPSRSLIRRIFTQ